MSLLETTIGAEFDWAAVPGPKWYRPTDVPLVLRALAHNPKGSGDLTSRALFAFGNNHAGTYYPVVLPVIPFLRQILQQGETDARMATMAVLEELTYFEPDAEFSIVAGPDGGDVPLAHLFERAVLSLRDILARLEELESGAHGSTLSRK
jgi:hypothetical protein